MSEPETIDQTLAEREKDYGYFADNAGYAQAIKCVFQSSPNWLKMEAHQREALDFIASKIGRLLSGNPNKPDTWHDIAGYAQLVETNLQGVKR
jgi:hypothetical protein